MTELTQARLRILLDYAPATGIFRRKIKVGGQPIGSLAGVIDADGYRVIRVDLRTFDTVEEARCAYADAARFLFGDFSRVV